MKSKSLSHTLTSRDIAEGPRDMHEVMPESVSSPVSGNEPGLVGEAGQITDYENLEGGYREDPARVSLDAVIAADESHSLSYTPIMDENSDNPQAGALGHAGIDEGTA